VQQLVVHFLLLRYLAIYLEIRLFLFLPPFFRLFSGSSGCGRSRLLLLFPGSGGSGGSGRLLLTFPGCGGCGGSGGSGGSGRLLLTFPGCGGCGCSGGCGCGRTRRLLPFFAIILLSGVRIEPMYLAFTHTRTLALALTHACMLRTHIQALAYSRTKLRTHLCCRSS
jgi:hypothetical protein